MRLGKVDDLGFALKRREMFRKVIKYSKILASSRATIHKFEPQLAQISTTPHAAYVDADGK